MLPQSDEDAGVGAKVEPTPLAASTAPVVIDFDGFQQRVVGGARRVRAPVRAAGRRRRRHGVLPGGAGGGGARRARRRRRAARCAATGCRDRSSAPFAANVADYAVSADGKKLVYRTPARAGARGRRRAVADASPGGRRRPRARRGAGRLAATLRMELDPKAEFRQIFNEGWRYQRDYLYVPNQQGADWPAMKTMYGQLLPHVDAPRRPQLPARHDGRRDRDRPLLRARRRPARPAARPAAGCWAPTWPSRTAATASPASTTARAGIPSCARRWRRPAWTWRWATTGERERRRAARAATTSTACSTARPTARPCSA